MSGDSIPIPRPGEMSEEGRRWLAERLLEWVRFALEYGPADVDSPEEEGHGSAVPLSAALFDPPKAIVSAYEKVEAILE